MATTGPAVFPGWDQLDFGRNCSAYGQWLAALIAPNPWKPQEALGGSIPLSIVLMTHALPPGWTFNDTSSSGGGSEPFNATATTESPAGTAYFRDVMQWFVDHMYATYNETNGLWYADPDFVANVVWDPATRCTREFCKAIAFTGNADLSGIGIVIAYYIEAAVTTIYLAVLSVWRIWRFLNKKRTRNNEKTHREAARRGRLARVGHRVFDALRGTFDSFFMTAAVLALAILVAVIVMETEHIHENHRHPVDVQNIPSGHALYDSALGLLVGLYAVFPVVVLYAIWPQEGEAATDELSLPLPSHDNKHTPGRSSNDGDDHENGAVSSVVLVTPSHASPSAHKPRRGRRTWLRRGVLVVLWGLAAAVVFLDPRSELDEAYQGVIPYGDDDDLDDDDLSNFAVALYACDQRGGRSYWLVLKALRYLIIGVPALWLLLTGLVYFVTGRFVWRTRPAADQRAETGDKQRVERAVEKSDRKRAAGEGPKQYGNMLQRLGRPLWRHVVAWLSAAIMWAILLCLTELRDNIIIVADGLDKENDWEFGQVLAIAAWAPPAVDFLFLLMCKFQLYITSSCSFIFFFDLRTKYR